VFEQLWARLLARMDRRRRNPIRAVHGTKKVFGAFDARRARLGSFGYGFYFYPDSAHGRVGASAFGGRMVEAEIQADRPMNVFDGADARAWDDLLPQRRAWRARSAETFMANMDAWLRARGFDSVYNEGRDEYVVYDPRKIKVLGVVDVPKPPRLTKRRR
jgi:hypothetical protein